MSDDPLEVMRWTCSYCQAVNALEDAWCRGCKQDRERVRTRRDVGTTHGAGCFAWGPKHYVCALTEIERLKKQ